MSGLSLLAILVLTGLTAFAFQQKGAAERNKDEALAARDEATMRKAEAEARKEEVIREQATSEFLQGTRLMEFPDQVGANKSAGACDKSLAAH